MRHQLRQRPDGKRGPLTGPNPTDRGKPGSKTHLITDHNGLTLSLCISGANTHDNLGLQPLVRGILPIRSRREPRRRRPAHAHTEKGHDYDRAELASRASHPPPHRSQKHRVLHVSRPTPQGRRENVLLASRMSTPAPPLRAQDQAFLGPR